MLSATDMIIVCSYDLLFIYIRHGYNLHNKDTILQVICGEKRMFLTDNQIVTCHNYGGQSLYCMCLGLGAIQIIKNKAYIALYYRGKNLMAEKSPVHNGANILGCNFHNPCRNVQSFLIISVDDQSKNALALSNLLVKLKVITPQSQ